ncbi:MAG: hypothetical protein IJV50_07545 [Lachnospiraceae bacterium]|nr:hypothetical protein [Lachnospiraceae bacterium]
MNWMIFGIEAAVFLGLFTIMVILPAKKNPAVGVHNYPKEIQEEYFKTHERIETAPLSKRTALVKSVGILMFVVFLSFGAWLCGVKGFWQGFLYAVLIFAIVGAYDTFFLDWVLFSKLPMFRLPGTEHMDEAYAQKWFHVKGMLFPGVLFALIIGVLTGLIAMAF